jgi:hypothetical protein
VIFLRATPKAPLNVEPLKTGNTASPENLEKNLYLPKSIKPPRQNLSGISALQLNPIHGLPRFLAPPPTMAKRDSQYTLTQLKAQTFSTRRSYNTPVSGMGSRFSFFFDF